MSSADPGTHLSPPARPGDGLTVVRVPLDSLQPDPGNVRRHDQVNLDAIRGSLSRFGQAEPLVVQTGTRRVIAGHGRLEAMRALGWTECDVVEIPIEGVDAVALGLALNRTAELADWDTEGLAKILEQLRTEDALDGIGYDDGDIDELLAELAEQDGPKDVDDPGPAPPPETPVSRAGDLWVLGEHRLLCGDATRAEDVARVMAGEKAALVATDPPYLVDYTGERPNDSGKDWTGTYREVDIEDADGFFRAVFTNILEVLGPGAAIYCWHAHKRSGLIQRVWADLGILDHQQIIWVKPASVFGRVYWHFRHEPCVMGWRQGQQPAHDGHHEFDSVWEVDWDGKARIQSDHPTSKPIELFARPMRKHTKVGDVVFEPFSGSGSQLVAAERERRRCRALELEPAYVDVAVRRWEQATDQQAVLETTGQTFADVAAERSTPDTAEGEP